MINFLFKKHLNFKVLFILALQIAGVVELVDTLDLGSSAARRGGSTPSIPTNKSIIILIKYNYLKYDL